MPKIKPGQNSTHPPSNHPPLAPPNYETKPFLKESFIQLTHNEHGRFMPNSEKVGHALILTIDNETHAYQYALPPGQDIPPATEYDIIPALRPIMGIHEEEKYGTSRFEGRTPNGTKMRAARVTHAQVTQNGVSYSGIIACFSPKPEGNKDFWGGAHTLIPLWSADLKPNVQRDLEKEIEEIGDIYKGGKKVEVFTHDVYQREGMKRTPDQNTVMGQSALKEYEAFFNMHKDEMSKEAKERFAKCINAPHTPKMEGNPRPEWLHLEGFGLTPLSKDPQVKNNLGAAPKWANTEMMIIERVAKWYALNRPESLIFIRPLFKMLLDSEVISEIDFFVSVEENDIVLKFHQDINPLIKYPIYRKASDIAQHVLVAYGLTNGLTPISDDKITLLNRPRKTVDWNEMEREVEYEEEEEEDEEEESEHIDTDIDSSAENDDDDDDDENEGSLKDFIDDKDDIEEEDKETLAKVARTLGEALWFQHKQDEVLFLKNSENEDLPDDNDKPSKNRLPNAENGRPNKKHLLDDDDDDEDLVVTVNHKKHKNIIVDEDDDEDQVVPVHHKKLKKTIVDDDEDDDLVDLIDEDNEKVDEVNIASAFNRSVVKIIITAYLPDYETPWNPPTVKLYVGTGSVFDKEKGLILTCQHVGNALTDLQLRLANDDKLYPAKVLIDEADSDLAILQCTDPEFLAKAQAVELGEFQTLGNPVLVVGFPETGMELTATSGTVSNNEFKDYTAGDTYNLVTTVTASINHGNSGGPVFDSTGKQIGVAFQGLEPGQFNGAGEVIPMPVIRQFLTSANQALASGTSSKGVPCLPFEIQEMTNPAERLMYGMPVSDTGIRVSSIDPLAQVGELKENDIILEIDGHEIGSDATIASFPEISPRLDFNYLIFQKQIGDSIKVKILREEEEKTLSIPLLYRANELKIIGRKHYARQAPYYIKNGICFQRLSDYHSTPDEDKADACIYNLKHTYLDQVPQEKPNEELIFINRILSSDLTQAYLCLISDDDKELVTAINGRPITNMRDVVIAMEQNKGPHHAIQLQKGETIILRQASPEEELDMAERYKIRKFYSDELEPLVANLRQAPVPATAPAGLLQFSTRTRSQAQSVNTSVTKEVNKL